MKAPVLIRWIGALLLLGMCGLLAGCGGGSTGDLEALTIQESGAVDGADACITGRVVAVASGKPIPGAMVVVDEMAADKTDNAGEFSIPGVAPGCHCLSVTASGYALLGDAIEIETGVGQNDVGDVVMRSSSDLPPPSAPPL